MVRNATTVLEMFKILKRGNTQTLLYQLTRREFRARYNSAKLGIAWAILNPLLLMLILSVVFSVFVKIPTGNLPYPIFVLNGLILWQCFRASIGTATSCVVDERNLYKKINFPRALVPISIVTSNFLNLILTFPILFAFMLFYNCAWHVSILLVPLNLAILLILAIGVALITSTITVYFRDMKYIVEPVLLILFYGTPLFYPIELVPTSLQTLYAFNPLVGIVTFQKEIMLTGDITTWNLLGISFAISLISLIVGILLYKRYSNVFADML